MMNGMRALRAVALVMGLALISDAPQAEVVRIASEEYPPYQGSQFPDHGLIAHLMTQAFALEGYEVEYGYFPWKRSYQYVKEGKWDAAPYWGWDEEREQDFLFSEAPILRMKIVLFYRRDLPFDWNSLEDLEGIEIGGISGYTYSDPFIAAVEAGRLSVNWSTQDESNFRKLIKGRIRVFAQGIVAGESILYKMVERGEITQAEADLITWHPKPLVERDLYLLFSRDKPQLRDAFDRGFRTLKMGQGSETYWEWLLP